MRFVKHLLPLPLTPSVVMALAVLLLLPASAGAHHSNCHRWHACPAADDSYVCGDRGYCTQCSDNQYCEAGKPRPGVVTGKKPFPIGSILRGRVTTVHDGDTITILDDTNTWHRIRLAGIDAPEGGQDFTKTSRKHLVSLVAGKTVTANWHKRDRYGRLVGIVFVDERDVGLEQIKAGMAWHYRKYQQEQSPEERERYAQAQNRARANRQGLWIYANPMPPWEWSPSRK
ncbi:MAG: thermonuclease family protein [Acidiferrobacterales bacterium]